MTDYRIARDEERAEVLDFLNMVFSMKAVPHDFRTLIPKVYGDDPCMRAEHFIARTNGRLEGVVARLDREWNVLGERLPVGMVGSVSTHPYARGAGHMKACMRMMIGDAEKKGLALLCLGGVRQRYEYFGFSQGGIYTTMRFTPHTFRHAWKEADTESFVFGDFAPWTREALELYDRQPTRVVRSEADFEQVCMTWRARPWAILRSGAFCGYLVASGDGFSISEICLADQKDYPAVLKAWHEAHGQHELTVEVPVWNREGFSALARVASSRLQGSVEMVRILDFPAVTRRFLTLKGGYTRLADGQVTLQIEDEPPMRIQVQDGRVTVETTGDPPDIRLNRTEAQELLIAPIRWLDTAKLPACVENWFPLPLNLLRADCF